MGSLHVAVYVNLYPKEGKLCIRTVSPGSPDTLIAIEVEDVTIYLRTCQLEGFREALNNYRIGDLTETLI